MAACALAGPSKLLDRTQVIIAPKPEMGPPVTSANSAPGSRAGDIGSSDAVILPAMIYTFAPLHRRAFGAATGAAAATFMALLTVACLTLPSAKQFPLDLVAQYFAGYSRSWTGVLVGASWGFAVGFVAGWFGAFCRNLVLAISAFFLRSRAELTESRDFLDYI
jgi:hypothetical protein